MAVYPRYIPGVATLELDAALCTGCGLCAVVCPHGVFALEQGRATVADKDGCMECGACALNCAAGAISVTPGVGCARAIINGWITGGPPSCDCGCEDEGGAGGTCC